MCACRRGYELYWIPQTFLTCSAVVGDVDRDGYWRPALAKFSVRSGARAWGGPTGLTTMMSARLYGLR
jgi:hypothetical protein